MIFNNLDFIAKKEENESVYDFCKKVILVRTERGINFIKCEIDDIYFNCHIDDTIDDLINKYTEAHKREVEKEELAENDSVKVEMFADTNCGEFMRRINDFIKDKALIDIKYSCSIGSDDQGNPAISDRAMVIYKEVK